jgi:hypothetical protein
MKSGKDHAEHDSAMPGFHCPSLLPTVYHASPNVPQSLHPSGRAQPLAADASAGDARGGQH